MLFNSFDFIFFFAAVLVTFWILPHRFRWILLLAASCFFYMYLVPVYILILVFLILLDYFCGIRIERARNKKLVLRLSLAGNLLILAFFKYWNFLNENLEQVLHTAGWHSPFPYSAFILPVGLSFHTFQSMSYTIDVYQGKTRAEKHLGYYALFVMFFPQLVAGPIERASGLLHQLKNRVVQLSYTDFLQGFSLMCRGFFMKVVVADQLAIYADSIYDHYEVNTGFTLVLATWFFAVRIYCDFAGYSDIARGAAKMMGYDMQLNFNLPYFSKSVTEFWRRWHISLSSWLRDYLYIPLGGSRSGKVRTYRNLLITMLLGGLWHGASWNFIIWGGLNGFYLSVEKMLGIGNKTRKGNYFLRLIKVFIVFNLICVTWVFFRSKSLAQAISIFKNIGRDFFSLQVRDMGVFANCIFVLCAWFCFDFFVFRKRSLAYFTENKKFVSLYLVNFIFILLILLFSVNSGSQFIYFQF
jgi:alginate O-acetyltransferase complex protein AlgI